MLNVWPLDHVLIKLMLLMEKTRSYTSHTLRVFYLNVRRWATEGHSDFLEAGVKRHLPSVADPTEVICGQQVDLGRLHGLLHPFQDLQRRKCKACSN